MKKVKFNVLDAIILLLIVVVAVAGILYSKGMLGFGGSGAAKSVTATYQLELTGKEPAFAEIPQVGDRVSVGVKETADAEVTDVEVKPSRRVTYDLSGADSGTAQWTEIPNQYDVILTLKSEATETDTEISSAGVELRVGQEEVVSGKGYAASGYILSVEADGEEDADNE